MSEQKDFWSRRKARVAEEAEAETIALEAEALAEAQDGKTDDELLQELGLPDPDAMGAGDDFSAFMTKAVPERLRVRALRKLWLTNPVLANVDGLVDYGEDFTDAACVIENLQTTYRVGQGMQAHIDEMARQAELAEAEEVQDAAPEDDEAPESQDDIAQGDDLLADADEDAAEAEPTLIAAEDAGFESMDHDDFTPAPRRRMQFRFEDQTRATA